MQPPQAQGAAGVGARQPEAVAEWDALRARLRAYLTALTDAEQRGDTARLRALCREGLTLLTETEAFTREVDPLVPGGPAAPC